MATYADQKRRIMQFLARNGPSLITEIKNQGFSGENDLSRTTIHRRLNGHKEDGNVRDPGLVAKGYVNQVTVTERMREEFNLESGAGPLYEVNEENIRNCPYIEDIEGQRIAEKGNEIIQDMKEKGVLESPDKESIRRFLEEFTDHPDAKFSDREEIDIRQEEITDSNGALTQEAFQRFIDFWGSIVARDQEWSVEVSISLKPKSGDRKLSDHGPDVMNFLTEDDFLAAIQENKKLPKEGVED